MSQLLDDFSKLEVKSRIEVNTLLKNGTYLHLMVVIIAAGLAFYEIETILVMGPVCSILAVLLFLFNYNKIREYQLLAGSTLLFCLFIFLLIVLLDWSPDDAQWPVSILGGIYTVGLLLFHATFHTKFHKL